MKRFLSVLILLVVWSQVAYSDGPPPDSDQYVSRKEYDSLKKEMDSLRAEIAAMRKERPAVSAEANQAQEVQALKTEVAALKQERAAQAIDANQVQTLKTEVAALKHERAEQSDVNDVLDELTATVAALKKEADRSKLGDTKFLITGFMHASYTDRRGEDSTFDAGFNPIFLWELNDRLFFEGQIEFALETPEGAGSSETETELEYANMNYTINDYMTVGAGKFLVPFGIFNERLHQDWINKLPDRPLIYDDEVGIAQESSIGAYLKGAIPYHAQKFNYALYIDNGPALITDDADSAGMLDFDNFSDNNHNKAVGGRIGYLPIPELEIGYSAVTADVNPDDFKDVSMCSQAIDFTYKRQFESLKGDLDIRTEWVWTDLTNATYDPTGELGFGPLSFDNDRRGYYVQAAYRPSLVEDRFLKNLEFVLRYDKLKVPSHAPGSSDEYRWTPGIDYWITPTAVVKVAYQFDETRGVSEDRNALLLQAAMGF